MHAMLKITGFNLTAVLLMLLWGGGGSSGDGGVCVCA